MDYLADIATQAGMRRLLTIERDSAIIGTILATLVPRRTCCAFRCFADLGPADVPMDSGDSHGLCDECAARAIAALEVR